MTLRLLARTAKNNGWSLKKLKEQLDIGNTPTGYTETERYEGLKQAYRQMYDSVELTRNEIALLRIFAALPYRNYDLEWSKNYLQSLLEEESIEDIFEKLWVKGWLEKSETGYCIHPFISECVLSTALTEAECVPFFNQIISLWKNVGKDIEAKLIPEVLYENDKYMKLDAKLLQSTMLVRSILSKLSGKLSEEYVKLYLVAIALEAIYYGISKAGLESLEKIKTKSSHLSGVTNAGLHIMLGSLQYEDIDGLYKVFQRVKEDSTVSDSLKFAFADTLGLRFYHAGRMEEAEKIYDYILENNTDDSIRIASYYVKSCIVVQSGDYSAYMEWMQKGIELARSSGREQSKDMQLLLSNLSDLYMAMGQFDEAEKLLEELEIISENKTYFVRQHILHRKGNLAMYRGDEGFGVEVLQESCKLAEHLYKDAEPSLYATCIVDLAMSLNKAKRFDESAEQYKNALSIYQSLSGYDFEKHRILNNMSVMYLDQGMPETALEYLPEAYERGKVLGGLAFAETANNYSKAYHALENREKEVEYLKEALPVLEKFYGSEHPKVVDAKERFAE